MRWPATTRATSAPVAVSVPVAVSSETVNRPSKVMPGTVLTRWPVSWPVSASGVRISRDGRGGGQHGERAGRVAEGERAPSEVERRRVGGAADRQRAGEPVVEHVDDDRGPGGEGGRLPDSCAKKSSAAAAVGNWTVIPPGKLGLHEPVAVAPSTGRR